MNINIKFILSKVIIVFFCITSLFLLWIFVLEPSKFSERHYHDVHIISENVNKDNGHIDVLWKGINDETGKTIQYFSKDIVNDEYIKLKNGEAKTGTDAYKNFWFLWVILLCLLVCVSADYCMLNKCTRKEAKNIDFINIDVSEEVETIISTKLYMWYYIAIFLDYDKEICKRVMNNFDKHTKYLIPTYKELFNAYNKYINE